MATCTECQVSKEQSLLNKKFRTPYSPKSYRAWSQAGNRMIPFVPKEQAGYVRRTFAYKVDDMALSDMHSKSEILYTSKLRIQK